MNKNHKKNVTNHSIKRSRQRTGVTKNQVPVMAKRAREEGLWEECTYGELRSLLRRFKRPNNNVRFYANAIYIFKKLLLITVIDADPKFEQNLIDYVPIPVYLWYKQNRLKRKSDSGSLVSKMYREVNDKLKNELNAYLAKNGGFYTYKAFTLSGARKGYVTLKSTKKEPTPEEKASIQQYIFRKYGLAVSPHEYTYEEYLVMKKEEEERAKKRKKNKLRILRKVALADTSLEAWETALKELSNSRAGGANMALIRHHLGKINPKYGPVKEADVEAFHDTLDVIMTSIAEDKPHDLIGTTYCSATIFGCSEECKVYGFVYQGSKMITRSGMLFGYVTNIQEVEEEDATTGKLISTVEEQPTAELADLWGQVQWQEDFSA